MSEVAPRETFALIRRLEDAGAVTAISLSLASRPDLSFEQFEAIGVFLSRLHDYTKWWIGDWVLEGEARFGEAVYQAAAALGRSERTLLNWAWTCRKVPRSRRRENLSFSHHVLVAPLESLEQTEWLDRAQMSGWSARDLGAALKERRELATGVPDPCGDLVAEMAVDLRAALRKCGLPDVDVAVEVSGAGFQYQVKIP